MILHEPLTENGGRLIEDELALIHVKVKHNFLLERRIKFAHLLDDRVRLAGDRILLSLLSLQRELALVSLLYIVVCAARFLTLCARLTIWFVELILIIVRFIPFLRKSRLVILLNLLDDVADVYLCSHLLLEHVLLLASWRVSLAARLGKVEVIELSAIILLA